MRAKRGEKEILSMQRRQRTQINESAVTRTSCHGAIAHDGVARSNSARRGPRLGRRCARGCASLCRHADACVRAPTRTG
eukprot:6209223-Pleurochrysis_carterae.AAC.1